MDIITIFVLVAVIILIGYAKQYIENGGKRKEKEVASYNYQRKKYFMTRAEHDFYDVLQDAVADDYVIFPQVHLSTIIDHKVKGQNWQGALAHIDRKSVDFVLCDKDYLSPRLVIELDDKSHSRKDRIARDEEVERILDEVGLPLLRIENHGSFDVASISESIRAAVSEDGSDM
ncbi:MAG: DUF2726 domain-containing protein [Candidatus Paceibacterota bacterium]